MRIARLRQRDGRTCGPSVAVMAGALLDPGYRSAVAAGQAPFAEEQLRVHAAVNAVWPRRLGTTPAGVAAAITPHSIAHGVRYRWRPFWGWWWGRRDLLADVAAAAGAGLPVAMLVGRLVPRHWVLIVEVTGTRLRCYEPSSGAVRSVDIDDVRRARMNGVGYPRAFAFVLPGSATRSATA